MSSQKISYMEHNSELELFLEQVFKVRLWNPAHQTLVKFESLGWKLPQLQIFSCDVLSWLLQRKVSLLILKWLLTFCSKLMQLLARKKHSFRCRGVTFITSVCNCEVVLRKVKIYSLRYQCRKKPSLIIYTRLSSLGKENCRILKSALWIIVQFFDTDRKPIKIPMLNP